MFLALMFVQCDSKTAEEYKAEAAGLMGRGDTVNAIASYIQAAKKGDVESQGKIGYLYLVGKELPGNPLKANKEEAQLWLERAAEHGLTSAYTILGMSYCQRDDRDGVDNSKAIKCFEVALSGNDKMAAYFLGDIYSCGFGVSINREKAINYFTIARDAGILMAYSELGELYYARQVNPALGLQIFEELDSICQTKGIDEYDYSQLWVYDFQNYFKANPFFSLN